MNIRVLTLIAYLAEAHGQVTVSSLISGHRLYSRPGVISAHIYGLAADISLLGGTSILGHQQQNSVTEKAVRNILLLPAEMQPRQVISLIGMGGPSFPTLEPRRPHSRRVSRCQRRPSGGTTGRSCANGARSRKAR